MNRDFHSLAEFAAAADALEAARSAAEAVARAACWRIRAERAISQQELADLLGVTQGYVSHVERGGTCGAGVLRRLALLALERPAGAPREIAAG